MKIWVLASKLDYFEAVRAFKELGTITWRFTYRSRYLKVNDIVYLYSGVPKQHLSAVLRVTNMPGTDIDDSSYFLPSSGKPKDPKKVVMTVDLTLEYLLPPSVHSDLSLNKLNKNGFAGNPQRLRSLTDETANYIADVLGLIALDSDVNAENLATDRDLISELESKIEDCDYSVEDKFAETKVRGSGQYVFARAVKKNYDYRCAITGISTSNFLIASHIVPWSLDESIRTDPSNGICLSVFVDRAFETGALTIEDNLEIKIDGKLSSTDPYLYGLLEQYDGTFLRAPKQQQPNPDFLRRRRELNDVL